MTKLTHDEAFSLRYALDGEDPQNYLADFLEDSPDTREKAVLELPLLNLYLEKQRELMALHDALFTCVKDLEYSRYEDEYSRYEDD